MDFEDKFGQFWSLHKIVVKIEWSCALFGEEMCKIGRIENQAFACFDVHKFRMSGREPSMGDLCRVTTGLNFYADAVIHWYDWTGIRYSVHFHIAMDLNCVSYLVDII